MRGQSLGALGLLLVGAIALFAFARPAEPSRVSAAEARKSWRSRSSASCPGLRQRRLRATAEPVVAQARPGGRLEVGDFPVNIAIHPTGEFAAVLCAGYREHEVMIVDLNPDRPRVLSRVQIDQAFYGLGFSTDGKQLFASGGEFEVVHVFDFDRGYLVKGRSIDVSVGKAQCCAVVGGISLDSTGRDLFVAAPWADAVVRVPLVNPDNKKVIPMVAVAAKKEPGKGEPPSPPDGRKEPKEKAKADDDQPPKLKEPEFYPYYLPRGAGRQACVRLALGARRRRRHRPGEERGRRNVADRRAPDRDGALAEGRCALRRLRELDEGERARPRDRARRCRRSTAPCIRTAPNGNTPNSLAPDARRRDALRRQRRREQPRRLQRRRSEERPSRSASSRPAGIRPRCGSTRTTRRSTSPTARA